MVQRATDSETAHEVLIAEDLARCGGSAALIERLTGFGARWVRRAVKRNGGALACKPQDPLRWFEKHPERLLHARCVVMAYERQPANRSPGRRLYDAYLAYRTLAPQSGLLDVNKCAEITQLYQSHNAWVRTCRECHLPHLVLSERSLCPVCRLLAREFCRGCSVLLPTRNNSARAYCDDCAPRASRLARKRQAKRPVQIPQSPKHVVSTPLQMRRAVADVSQFASST